MRLWSLVGAFVTIGLATLALPGSVGVATSPPTSTPPSSDVIAKQMGAMPLPFTKNEGQWDERVLFRTSAGGATIWFCRDGITYQFTHRVPKEDTDPDDPKSAFRHPRPMGTDDLSIIRDSIETVVVHAKFVSANPNVAVIGDNLLDYKCNYFIGNDPLQWRTDVPNYAGIVYRDVYPGIDAHFEGADGQFKTRWEVRDDADRSRIRFEYAGNAEVTETVDGELVIEAPWGVVFQSEPIVSQGETAHTAGASSAAITLVYSTFLGGSGYDYGYGIAVDVSGSAYVTGWTESADFPTQDPYDGSHNGNRDVFVTKLSAAGNALEYSTFLGGSSSDYGYGIAVDADGRAYVTGNTISTDFPTLNPYDGSYNGENDVFVTKLSAAGNALVYSTFLGGSSDDRGYGIAVDVNGSAYVTGTTGSADFPTQNPYDGSFNGGYDVFVTKLSAAGNALVYSTFLEGISIGYGIAVDADGRAYVTGYTYSTDFPTLNPYDGSYNGENDVFVTKLSAAGNALEYSTFIGGSGHEIATGIAVDVNGCAYVTGMTRSYNFPTQNPYDGSHNGNWDVFVTKLSAAGNALEYSTFLGGSSSDYGYGIAVDADGRAYVTGYTYSTDFPTQNPYDGSHNGSVDVFVTKLSAAGNALEYSTFLGGSSSDYGYGIAVDADGRAYVTGYTYSTDFPMQNPYDGSHNGVTDVFVTKLGIEESPPADPSTPTITGVFDAGTGSDLVVKWTQPDRQGVTDYQVYVGVNPGEYVTSGNLIDEDGTNEYQYVLSGLEEHTPYFVAVRAHDASIGSWSDYATWPPGAQAELPIRPSVPVVLVHGWRSGPEKWNDPNSTEDYFDWLTIDGFSNIWIPDLDECGPEGENQFDKNAQTLAGFILAQREALQQQTGVFCSEVNIVAHSMGGLVSRRLIAERSEFGMDAVKVRSLTMLGTPNGGTLYANAACVRLCIPNPLIPCDNVGHLICWGPATCELSSLNMDLFNHEHKRPIVSGEYTSFYAVAGNACCGAFRCKNWTCPFGESDNHDGTVAVSSVFAIVGELDRKYVRNEKHGELPLNKQDIFDPIVVPILRGDPPSSDVIPSPSSVDSSSTQTIHASTLATDSVLWAEDTVYLNAASAVTFWTYGLSADPEIELYPPSGPTIDSALALSDSANYEYFHDDGIAALSVLNPADGPWIVRVRTHGWQSSESYVNVFAEAESDVRLTFYNFLPLGEQDDSVLLHARLIEGFTPVINASVEVLAVLAYDTLPTSFDLHDDGMGVDSEAGDGIYSGVFTQTQGSGVYTFFCNAAGQSSEAVPFTRVAFLQTLVTGTSRGDMNADGVYDVLDVVMLVNFTFRGATGPYPLLISDVNCDGVSADILDVVRLIDHTFRGAPSPECH